PFPPRLRAARQALPSRRLLLGDDVRDPGAAIFRLLARTIDARTVAVLVLVLPVDVALREPCLEQQLAELRQGPEAPLIREGALQLAAVLELEMDVVGDRVINGVERVL